MKTFFKKNKNTIIICLFLLSLICFVLLKTTIDPDYYWHIQAGRYMLDNKIILTKDIFSWVPQIFNTYWMSHEWLFELLLGVLEKIFSSWHVIVYIFISISLLLLTLFMVNKKKYLENIPFTLFWFTLSIFFLMTCVTPRPQLLDFIFLAISLYLLYSLINDESSKKIYFLPLISIAWSNLHGGSSNMPYLLTLIFIIVGMFNFKFSKVESKKLSKKQFQKYIIIFILCVGAVSLNPHGLKMLFYPYENMNNKIMLQTITEWRPTNLNEMYHWLFFIFFGINILVLLFSKKKIKFIDLGILAFTLFLGLKSIRFWMFFYVASTLIIPNYIDAYKVKEKDVNYILIIVVLIISLSLTGYSKTLNNLKQKPVSDEIIDYLKKNEPKRLYNYYDYGGYLIYNNILVFVDGRADLYSKYNYKEANDLSNLRGNFQKIIEKYKFDYFLLKKKSGLSYYLKERQDYDVVISDAKNIVYKKR